jgi:hypothetical protein
MIVRVEPTEVRIANMPISNVNIGTKRIWMTAYNPSDELARVYCAFAVSKAASVLRDIPLDEVHGWIRKRFPHLSEMLDAVERGEEVPRDIPIGEYPVTPGQEEFEAPIVTHLMARKKRRQRQ